MEKLFTNPKQTERRKILRKEMSKGERILWFKIRNSQIGYKFRRQHSIGPYVADFYCSEVKLVVEVDGITHQANTQFIKDKKRDLFFISLGILTKRYISDIVFSDIDSVLIDIKNTSKDLVNKQKSKTTPNLPLAREE